MTRTSWMLVLISIFFACPPAVNAAGGNYDAVVTQCPYQHPGHSQRIALSYGIFLEDGEKSNTVPEIQFTDAQGQRHSITGSYLHDHYPNAALDCHYDNGERLTVPVKGKLHHCGLVYEPEHKATFMTEGGKRVPRTIAVWCSGLVPW